MIAAKSPGWRAGVEPVLRAVRTHWRPFVLIQIAAVAVACAYYLLPAFQDWAAVLARIKVRGGLPFAALTTGFAAVVLPELAKRAFSHSRPKPDWADLGWQFCMFGFLGMTVDLLYRGLGVLFGTAPTIGVVAEKLAFDQLIYSPIVSITVYSGLFLWKDAGFSMRSTAVLMRDGTFAKRYIGNMVACWLFWIPALSAIYSMPINLQFCLYLCVEAAWALLVVSMAGRE